MVAWAIPAAIGAAGLLSGLLDDSDETSADAMTKSAQIGARKSYPGQHKIAKSLAPFLWENLDVGLTEQEKQTFRGAGRTSVLQGNASTRGQVTKTAASQGLRGGTIAEMLSRINPAQGFSEVESGISQQDILLKRKRMDDILKFLSLEAGKNPDGSGNKKNKTISDTVEEFFRDNGGPGVNYGGDPGGFDPSIGVPGVPGSGMDTPGIGMGGALP